jgi:hypothetical protein
MTWSRFLHGGGQGAGGPSDLVGPTDGGQCYYRYANGRFFNGLVAVAYELESVAPGDGGFACVAGSHKANIELPRDWKMPLEDAAAGSTAELPSCIHQVAVDAGDAIIFTEACAHGTLPWTGPPHRARHTAFYKYCPHAVAWAPVYYSSEEYERRYSVKLSDSQRALLTPPSAFGALAASVWEQAQAERRELLELRQRVAGLENQQSNKRNGAASKL